MRPNYKAVPCPKCGATAGSPCLSTGGLKMAAGYPHMDRVRAFVGKKRDAFARTTDSSSGRDL